MMPPQIKATTAEAYNLFHKGALALAQASQNGMRVNVSYCENWIGKLTKKIRTYEERFWETKTGKLWKNVYGNKANVGSDHQLRNVLFNKLGYASVKETTGELPAVDRDSLMAIEDKSIKYILSIRSWSKAKGTYLEALLREQVDGVVHPFANLHTTKSFRSSYDRPNFQNIPKRDKQLMQTVRGAIFPREGHQILGVDFSGIEVRIAACYHKDPVMIKYIKNPASDMHKDMAIQLYKLEGLDKSVPGERQLRHGAKNGFVFPQFYGDYYGNNAPILLHWTQEVNLKDGTPALEHLAEKRLITLNKQGRVKSSQSFINHVRDVEDDFWNRRFKVYQKWKDRHYKQYQRDGYVDMFTGFRCGGVMRKNQVINIVVQGAAFHCLLWTFIKVHEMAMEEDWDTMLIGQIHDEMVMDANPDETNHVLKTVNRIACRDLPDAWPWIIVPMKVEASACLVNGSWAEIEDIEME